MPRGGDNNGGRGFERMDVEADEPTPKRRFVNREFGEHDDRAMQVGGFQRHKPERFEPRADDRDNGGGGGNFDMFQTPRLGDRAPAPGYRGGGRDRAETAPPPRPAADEGDQDTKKRNRRMFAGILGTLNKFSKEERKNSALAAKRRSIVQAAEEKKEEESRRLKDYQRESFVVKRSVEEAHKAQLELKMNEKELELAHFTYLETKAKLEDGYLLTTATPSIYYKPVTHIDETRAAMEKGKEDAGGAAPGKR